ncbi:hypothetical protein D3C72_1259750 [compost metagenome]
MGIDTQIHGWIGDVRRDIDHLLPEGAAQHGAVPFVDDPEASRADLAVATAHHHRRAGGKPGFFGCLRSDPAYYGAGLRTRREDIVAHARLGHRIREPVARRKAIKTGRAGI